MNTVASLPDRLAMHARDCVKAADMDTDVVLSFQQLDAMADDMAEAAAALASPTPSAPDLDAMVSRFLRWRLPDDFAPDSGISFTPISNPAWTHDTWPIGTNLLTAVQARAMLEYVLNMPAGAPRAQKPLDETANNAGVATGSRNVSPSESVTPGSPPASLSSAPPSVAGDARERLNEAAANVGHITFESMRQCADSWLAVNSLLHELVPDWTNNDLTGREAALAAIRRLATAEQPGSAVQGEAASFADGVKSCIAWVERRRHDFEEEWGSVDPATNTMEFGTVEREEYDAGFVEIEEGLRRLLPTPAAAPTASCSWSQQEEGDACYNTGCGHEYTVLGGEDGEVYIPYCPYCAQRIETSAPPAPAAEQARPEARGVEGMVPAISPNGTDDDMLAYLDKLLTVQGQLMFARENYDEEAAETFGVAILDFMRLYGMRLRAKLASAPAAPGAAVDEIVIDGKRYALDTVRTALLGLASNYAAIASKAQEEHGEKP